MESSLSFIDGMMPGLVMTDMEETTQPLDLLNYSSTWVTVTEIIDEIVPSTHLSTEVVIVLSVVLGVIIFMTVVGNLLVVIAFCTTPELRTYNNYFIMGLACMDLLVGTINMPMFAMIIILGRWPLGETFCDIFSFLDHALPHASILLVTLISLDRCIAVTYPIRYRLSWRRRSRAILIIAISYIIPVIIWLPMTTLWQVIHGIDQRPFLDDVCLPLYIQSIMAGFLVPLLYIITPFAITTVLCARIYIVISHFYKERKKMRIAIGNVQSSNMAEETRDTGASGTTASVSASSRVDNEVSYKDRVEHRRVVNETKDVSPTNMTEGNAQNKKVKSIDKKSLKGVRQLAFIVTVMGIAWSPPLLVTSITPLCADCVPVVVYRAAIFWGYMNSLLNPISYALADEAFKTCFIRILTLRCLQSDRGVASLQANNI